MSALVNNIKFGRSKKTYCSWCGYIDNKIKDNRYAEDKKCEECKTYGIKRVIYKKQVYSPDGAKGYRWKDAKIIKKDNKLFLIDYIKKIETKVRL